MRSVVAVAAKSATTFVGLLMGHNLHLSAARLGGKYAIKQRGTYAVFRETVCSAPKQGESVVLVVGFRLKLLRSSGILHWLFQRLCILTTPFWSGFKGFGIKLWMVDRKTKNYLGIYKWEGEANARMYVDVLQRVLNPLSVNKSVWHQIYRGKPFEAQLQEWAA